MVWLNAKNMSVQDISKQETGSCFDKAEYAGKFVEFVNPAGTSQTCICGFSVPKKLSERIHICPSCGFVMGRDQVSAILIENRPSSTVGSTGIYAHQGLLNRGSMQWEAPGL